MAPPTTPETGRPRLTDGVVVLRPWERGDAPAVQAACQDREIARHVPIPQPYTGDEASAFVDRAIRAWDGSAEAPFAISPSGRVAERIGFVREGVRRAWSVDRDGSPLDAVFYVRIRDGA